MTKRQKLAFKISISVAIVAAAGILIWMIIFRPPSPSSNITLDGEVLRQGTDPARQTPLADVKITANAGSRVFSTKSQPSGLFTLTFRQGFRMVEKVTLTFEHPDYKTLVIVATHPGDQLYIARMQPLKEAMQNTSEPTAPLAKIVQISNVRVRYSVKEESTVNVGSLSKQFRPFNVGNVPCRGRPPCSPDGRWAATMTNLPLDAGDENEFHNLRILCLAGPCGFTKVLSPAHDKPARKVTVSVLNWSDATTFLVEADVVRAMATESVQYAYPFIVEQTLDYALPAGSQGTTMEGDFDGQYIVFPLGPAMLLSWATCSVELSHEDNKIYRCTLKPGYRFQE